LLTNRFQRNGTSEQNTMRSSRYHDYLTATKYSGGDATKSENSSFEDKKQHTTDHGPPHSRQGTAYPKSLFPSQPKAPLSPAKTIRPCSRRAPTFIPPPVVTREPAFR